MEIKLNVDGVEVAVTVANATEAAALIASLRQPAPPASVAKAATAATPSVVMRSGSDTAPESSSENEVTDLEIKRALERMRGSDAARVLTIISNQPHLTCRDDVLKSKFELPEGQNFGPVFSYVTKSCLKEGFGVSSVVATHKRRASDKKTHYWYVLTDRAARILKSLPDYDKPSSAGMIHDLDL